MCSIKNIFIFLFVDRTKPFVQQKLQLRKRKQAKYTKFWYSYVLTSAGNGIRYIYMNADLYAPTCSDCFMTYSRSML